MAIEVNVGLQKANMASPNGNLHIGSAWFQRKIKLRPQKRGVHLVTDEILRQVPELKQFSVGMCHLQSKFLCFLLRRCSSMKYFFLSFSKLSLLFVNFPRVCGVVSKLYKLMYKYAGICHTVSYVGGVALLRGLFVPTYLSGDIAGKCFKIEVLYL